HHLAHLGKVHLGRRRQDHRVGALDALGKVAGVVLDAVFVGDLRGGLLVAADQRGDLHAGNAFQRVEMFLSKGPLARNADLHAAFLVDLDFFFGAVFFTAAVLRGAVFLALLAPFSRMMWPTAVFEAGTV